MEDNMETAQDQLHSSRKSLELFNSILNSSDDEKGEETQNHEEPQEEQRATELPPTRIVQKQNPIPPPPTPTKNSQKSNKSNDENTNILIQRAFTKLQQLLKESSEEVLYASLEMTRVLTQKQEALGQMEGRFEATKEELTRTKLQTESTVKQLKMKQEKIIQIAKQERETLVAEHKEQLQAVEEDLRKMLEEKNASEREFAKLLKNFQSKDEELQNIKKSNLLLQSQLKDFQSTKVSENSSQEEVEKLKNEIQSLKQMNSLLQSQLKELQNQPKSATQKQDLISTSTQQVIQPDFMDEDVVQPTQPKNSSSGISSSSSSPPADLTLELEKLQATVALLQTENEELRAHSLASNSIMNGGFDQIDKLGEIKNLRSRLEYANQELSFLKQQLGSKGKQESVIRTECSKEVERLKTQLIFRDEEIRNLHEELIERSRSPSPSSGLSERGTSPNLENEPSLSTGNSSKKRKFLKVPSSSSSPTKKAKKRLIFEEEEQQQEENATEIVGEPLEKQDEEGALVEENATQTTKQKSSSSSPPKRTNTPNGLTMRMESDEGTGVHTITSTGGVRILIQPAEIMTH